MPCAACGYALVGLGDAKTCPECGCGVLVSVRARSLATSDPAWVRQLMKGAGSTLGVPTLVGLVGAFAMRSAMGIGRPINSLALGGLNLLVIALALCAALYATMALTAQPPDRPPKVGAQGLTRSYRAIVIAMFAVGMLGVVMFLALFVVQRGGVGGSLSQTGRLGELLPFAGASVGIAMLLLPAHFVLSMLHLGKLLELTSAVPVYVRPRVVVVGVPALWVLGLSVAQWNIFGLGFVVLALIWNASVWAEAQRTFQLDARRADVYAMASIAIRRDPTPLEATDAGATAFVRRASGERSRG